MCPDLFISNEHFPFSIKYSGLGLGKVFIRMDAASFSDSFNDVDDFIAIERQSHENVMLYSLGLIEIWIVCNLMVHFLSHHHSEIFFRTFILYPSFSHFQKKLPVMV